MKTSWLIAALSLMAMSALAGVVIVTHAPTLAGVEQPDLATCIETARGTLGSTPRECVQVTSIAGTCADVPKPEPAKDVIFDANAVKYADPANNVSTPGVAVRADGVEYTFTDAGSLEGHLCPDGVSYSFTQTQMIPSNEFPSCWKLAPVQVTTCESVLPDGWNR